MPTLTDWHPLLTVQAGAAATLTGLVFVAVSLNLRRILEVPGLSGRAAESLLLLVQIFFVSSLTLVPGQPLPALGCEVLIVVLLSWVAQTRVRCVTLAGRRGIRNHGSSAAS